MDLTPTRVERLQHLFEQALEIPADQRGAFLDRESGANSALRDEVLALVAARPEPRRCNGRCLSRGKWPGSGMPRAGWACDWGPGR